MRWNRGIVHCFYRRPEISRTTNESTADVIRGRQERGRFSSARAGRSLSDGYGEVRCDIDDSGADRRPRRCGRLVLPPPEPAPALGETVITVDLKAIFGKGGYITDPVSQECRLRSDDLCDDSKGSACRALVVPSTCYVIYGTTATERPIDPRSI